MLIFFGIRSTKRGTSIQTDYTCPACGEPDSITITSHQRYFHIFWIPVFPVGKEYSRVCNDCGAYFTGKHLPLTPEIKRYFKTPMWSFSGLLIVGIFLLAFITLGAVVANRNNSEIAAKLENPQVGDLYEVKLASKEYSLRKVVAVTPDSIYFLEHEYYVERASRIKLLLEESPDDFDEDEIIGFTKQEVIKGASVEKIINIQRK